VVNTPIDFARRYDILIMAGVAQQIQKDSEVTGSGGQVH
jgi:hypothetical protein